MENAQQIENVVENIKHIDARNLSVHNLFCSENFFQRSAFIVDLLNMEIIEVKASLNH